MARAQKAFDLLSDAFLKLAIGVQKVIDAVTDFCGRLADTVIEVAIGGLIAKSMIRHNQQAKHQFIEDYRTRAQGYHGWHR